jgi:integrase/recombinase XerD
MTSPHALRTPFASLPAAIKAAWRTRRSPLLSAQKAFARFHWWTVVNGIPDPLPCQTSFGCFLDHLRRSGAPSESNHIRNLLSALRVIAPERNWTWLRQELGAAERRGSAGLSAKYVPRRKNTVALQEWPERHGARWEAATNGRHSAKEEFAHRFSGNRQLWQKPRTLDHWRDRYSRWLFSMRRAGRSDVVTFENAVFYVDEMVREGLTLTAIAITIDGLLGAMKVVEPKEDWEWLSESRGRLRALAVRGPKCKSETLVNPARLWGLGLRLIDEARDIDARNRKRKHRSRKAAIRFRDGLLVCVLACVPVRIECLWHSDIGQHLFVEEDIGWLRFAAEETKEDRADTRLLSFELVELLVEYRRQWRTRLKSRESDQALWIGRNGRRLSVQNMRRIITDNTFLHLGVRITPHLVRDCVATLIKQRYPDKSEVAIHILHHGSETTGRCYQEQCRQIEVQRRALVIMKEHECALRRKFGLSV